ncbi:MAG: nucleotidyl transferase AbiEii/AbiGii toxin family protein, partial [Alphaproteobacteria bacterium]|nr:nucleotidyl transferase AbiEii/AbiGii toxin family protein [Alphaproteobacteria bacterium]
MMQQSHLTEWQIHAPWPRRSQIEQDLRLSRGVVAIFGDEVLRTHLAMRGGTVLHKAHLAPAARYSEDIDLVLIKPMDADTLDQHLRRVLTPVLGQPADSLMANVQCPAGSPQCAAAVIGIGGSLARPPLPHHRTYGSVSGGSTDYAGFGAVTVARPI